MEPDQQLLKLINEVSNRPIIYDKSKFQSKYGRLNAWKEVAKALDITVHLCKTKWRELKETFVKFHRESLLDHDTFDASEVDWPYFDKMLFYLPQIDQMSSSEDDSSNEVDVFKNTSNNAENKTIEPPSLNPAIQESLMALAAAQEDPDHQFLMSLLPLMKKLTPQQNAQVRMELQKILYELEFNKRSTSAASMKVEDHGI